MELDLLGLLEGRVRTLRGSSDGDGRGTRVAGVLSGVVTDVRDPQGLGRVRIRFPNVSGRVESAWARVAAPWAGSSRRGAYFLPEVDDEVLVAFRGGDLGHPYVVGFLWSQNVPPPQQTTTAATTELRSRTGHALRFVDTAGSGKVVVTTSTGYRLELDETSGGSGIRLSDPQKRLQIAMDGEQGTVSVEVQGAGEIALKVPDGKLSVSASIIEIKSDGPLELEGAAVTIKGHPVALNPPG
jgi:uncharacterized protein involved in type VI secretion and phage assembly